MLVILDLEATCGGDSNFVGEIIEIGAVKYDLNKREIIDRYQSFVKPIINPTLTDFCKNLTSITQEDINRAHRFDSVYRNFVKWYGNPTKNLFCSWGYFDKAAIKRDCKLHNLDYMLGHEHWNIKRFYQNMTAQKGVGLGTAVKQMGLEFKGTAHRAISDAENTALVLHKLLEK